MLSRKVLTLGKSISLAIGNNDNDDGVVIDDKDVPLTAFSFGSLGDICGCETVTFSFSELPLCFFIYTSLDGLTIFIVIVTTATECRDQTGTPISCCRQK